MDYESVISLMHKFFYGEYFCPGKVVIASDIKGEKQDPFGEFDPVYVDQGGGGITGDDFHGTVYFHIGGGKFATAEY